MPKFTRPKFTKLHAQQGSDEANHDGVSYRVDNDGNITVPEDAVAPLVAIGGFIRVDDDRDEVPDGLVALKHGEVTTCSWGGNTYDRREDGAFFVPCAAAADLIHHGFVGADVQVAVDEPPAPADEPKPKLKFPK